LQGTVGGKFSILGGLVKGNCQFQMTVGDECRIQGTSPLEGERIIADLNPRQGDEDVDIFIAPQAVFNLPLDKEFEFTNSEQQTKSFRAKLGSFGIYDGSTEIPSTLKWNEDKTVAAISPVDIPPAKKQLKVKVSLLFDEKIMGAWRPVFLNGKAATEMREATFTTGDAPGYIPLSNVQYSYPLIDQYNFYPQETDKGYIKLQQGQPDLFKTSDDWTQLARFSTASGEKMEFPFTYTDAKISFILPKGMTNNTIYSFEVINIPKRSALAVDANVQEASLAIENTGVEMRNRSATGTLTILKEKSIFVTHFRTSRFNRFLEKINSMPVSEGAFYPIYPDIHQIVSRMEGAEVFDKYEIQRSEKFDRLVQFEADLSNRWYSQFMGPLVYDGYPYADATVQHRPAELLGVPPVRAISLQQLNGGQLLTPAEVQNNMSMGTSRSSSIVNNMVFEVYQDYYELKQKAAYLSQWRNDAWIHRMLGGGFRAIMPGTYKLNIRYVLPGTKETTSEVQKTITLN
jgi:hypothetical protein